MGADSTQNQSSRDGNAFFAAAVCLGMATGYFFIRHRFAVVEESHWRHLDVAMKSVAAALALLFIPHRKHAAETLGLLLAWTLVGTLVWWAPTIGPIGVAVTLGLLLHRFRVEPPRLSPTLLGVVALGLLFGGWLTTQVWNGAADEIFLTELLPYKYITVDRLVHASGIQMFNTHAVPTVGVDGLSHVRYHYGSHWISAMWVRWLEVPPLVFLHLVAPLLFIPLCLRAILDFADDFRKDFRPFSVVPYLFVVVAFVALLPYPELDTEPRGWHRLFRSFSYNLGVTIAFLTLSLFSKVPRDRLLEWGNIAGLSFFLGLLFWIKVSTGYTLLMAVGFLFLRSGALKKHPVRCLVPVFVSMIVFAMFATRMPLEVQFAAFWKTMTWGHRLLYVPIQYGLTLAYLAIRLCQNQSDRKPMWDVETLLFVTVLGALPGLVVNFNDANHSYFVTDQKWLALAFLLALYPLSPMKNAFPRRVSWGVWSVGAAVGCFFLVNAVATTSDMVERQVGHTARLVQKKPKLEKLMDGLRALDQLPRQQKRESIVYIPRAELRWMNLNCYTLSFAGPALSGHALLDAIPPEGCDGTKFGLESYPPRKGPVRQLSPAETCRRATTLGFKGVWRWTWETDSFGYQSCVLLSQK